MLKIYMILKYYSISIWDYLMFERFSVLQVCPLSQSSPLLASLEMEMEL